MDNVWFFADGRGLVVAYEVDEDLEYEDIFPHTFVFGIRDHCMREVGRSTVAIGGPHTDLHEVDGEAFTLWHTLVGFEDAYARAFHGEPTNDLVEFPYS